MSAKLVLPLDFTWTAPDTCPTQAEVVEQLSRAVDAGGKELPQLTARALVQQDGSAWRLELTTEMDGRRGTRQLEADSCEGLARAATLVLALTLGEGMARRQAQEEEKQAAPPAPPPLPPVRAEPPPPPQQARVRVGAGAGIGIDPLGGVVPAFALEAALQPNWLRLGVRLGLTLPSSTELAGSGSEVHAFSWSAELKACFAPALRPVQVAACALGGITLLDAEGKGSAQDDQATIPLYGLGPSVELSWLVHEHAFLGLGLASRFFVKRPELVVEGWPRQRTVEAVSGSAELGGGMRW
ncbi:MAG TPA: hypothetical protein VIW29_09350 [Polyangiaceae bacterium]